MKNFPKAHIAAFAVTMSLLLTGGYMLGGVVSSPPVTAATRTLAARTIISNHTHVLTKIVRGRVIRLKGGQRVVRVPVVVIHNLRCHPTPQHHCVRRVIVPAHTIPLIKATIHAAIATAAVSVPVTVYVTVAGPTTTVQGPTTTLPAVTVTLPQATTTITIPTTITVPGPSG